MTPRLRVPSRPLSLRPLVVATLTITTIALTQGACMSSKSAEPSTPASATTDSHGHPMHATRVFDATPEQMWSAWTNADHLKRWWGPTGFSCPVARMDVRKGGTSLVCMRAPAEFGGQDMYNTWTYTRVDKPRRLEFVFRFSDGDGRPIDPTSIGLQPDMPREVRHVVIIRPINARQTELTVEEYSYPSPELVELSRTGLEQCLDKMAATFAHP